MRSQFRTTTKAVLKREKKILKRQFCKKTACSSYVQLWLVVVDGWRLVAIGGPWLAVGDWWLVAVGMVGGWLPLVAGGWRLVVGGPWGGP